MKVIQMVNLKEKYLGFILGLHSGDTAARGIPADPPGERGHWPSIRTRVEQEAQARPQAIRKHFHNGVHIGAAHAHRGPQRVERLAGGAVLAAASRSSSRPR